MQPSAIRQAKAQVRASIESAPVALLAAGPRCGAPERRPEVAGFPEGRRRTGWLRRPMYPSATRQAKAQVRASIESAPGAPLAAGPRCGAPERRPSGRVSGRPPTNRVAEVVKPADLVTPTQWGVRVMTPTLKDHGREQPRSIYGPACTTPEPIERPRRGNAGSKMTAAPDQFAPVPLSVGPAPLALLPTPRYQETGIASMRMTSIPPRWCTDRRRRAETRTAEQLRSVGSTRHLHSIEQRITQTH